MLKLENMYPIVIFKNGVFSILIIQDDEYEQEPDCVDFLNEDLVSRLLANPTDFLEKLIEFTRKPGMDDKILGGYTVSGSACWTFDDESTEDAFLDFLTKK